MQLPPLMLPFPTVATELQLTITVAPAAGLKITSFAEVFDESVELSIGDGDSTAEHRVAGKPVAWPHLARPFPADAAAGRGAFACTDFGPIETLFDGSTDEGARVLENPSEAIATLLAHYPDAERVQLHPADVSFFVSLCSCWASRQLRAGDRQGCAALVAQRFAVAGARRPLSKPRRDGCRDITYCSYHMNKTHWNSVSCTGGLEDGMIRDLVEDSYDLVVASLPRRDRESLGWTRLAAGE